MDTKDGLVREFNDDSLVWAMTLCYKTPGISIGILCASYNDVVTFVQSMEEAMLLQPVPGVLDVSSPEYNSWGLVMFNNGSTIRIINIAGQKYDLRGKSLCKILYSDLPKEIVSHILDSIDWTYGIGQTALDDIFEHYDTILSNVEDDDELVRFLSGFKIVNSVNKITV